MRCHGANGHSIDVEKRQGQNKFSEDVRESVVCRFVLEITDFAQNLVLIRKTGN